jgi:8-oxo-dGTP pyrophosphatase MutT (NUDIX family)
MPHGRDRVAYVLPGMAPVHATLAIPGHRSIFTRRVITADELARRLHGRKPVPSAARGRAASVLIPFVDAPDGPRLVFIKRTESLPTHKGQYAFPGGSRDATDESAVHTALREAHEEIGLPPGDVRVLGTLDQLSTHTGFVITPVVGWVTTAPRFTPNPHEVERVVDLPLAPFLERPRPHTLHRDGVRRIVLAFDVEGHFIWGVTASIVRYLALVIAPVAEAV